MDHLYQLKMHSQSKIIKILYHAKKTCTKRLTKSCLQWKMKPFIQTNFQLLSILLLWKDQIKFMNCTNCWHRLWWSTQKCSFTLKDNQKGSTYSCGVTSQSWEPRWSSSKQTRLFKNMAWQRIPCSSLSTGAGKASIEKSKLISQQLINFLNRL